MRQKIIETLEQHNTDSSRNVLASIQLNCKRNRPSPLKDAPKVQAPAQAGEPPSRIDCSARCFACTELRVARTGSAVCDSACWRPTSTRLCFGTLHAGRDDGEGFIHPAASERWPSFLSPHQRDGPPPPARGCAFNPSAPPSPPVCSVCCVFDSK